MQIRNTLIHSIATKSGRWEGQSEAIIVAILGYIVAISLLTWIHRKVLRKNKKIHENIVLVYDTIRYQLAKAQYSNPIIQDSKRIRIITETEHKNYLANQREIKEKIIFIEQSLWQEIVGADQRTKIDKLIQKKKRLTVCTEITGRFITTITVGSYKLFW